MTKNIALVILLHFSLEYLAPLPCLQFPLILQLLSLSEQFLIQLNLGQRDHTIQTCITWLQDPNLPCLGELSSEACIFLSRVTQVSISEGKYHPIPLPCETNTLIPPCTTKDTSTLCPGGKIPSSRRH